jgi:branched-chain amino acid transport system ATP-binding protein
MRVESGSVHGIIGPNGSGKSTLINLISAYDRPDTGKILLFGKDISTLPEHAVATLGVSRTYQDLHLVKGLTVLENVLLGLHSKAILNPAMIGIRGRSFLRQERAQVARAVAALEFVGLSDLADRASDELSGGQMRLVEIARAVVGEPRLILMDEPAAGLSLVRIDMLKGIIDRISSELGITVIMVEHVLNVVMNVSDRITVLDAGAVLTEGVPEDVRLNERVRDVYFGRTPAELAERREG